MHTISSPAALATALNVLSPRMEVNFYDGRFFYVAARMLVARESPYDLERYRARLRDSAQRYPDAGAELRAEIESYPYPPASLIVFATARAPRDSACSPLWRWSSACFDAARAAAALARAGCRLRRRRLAVISNRGLEYNQPATSHGGLFLGARSAAFAAANLFLIPAGVIAVLLAAWQRERYPKHTALVAAILLAIFIDRQVLTQALLSGLPAAPWLTHQGLHAVYVLIAYVAVQGYVFFRYRKTPPSAAGSAKARDSAPASA